MKRSEKKIYTFNNFKDFQRNGQILIFFKFKRHKKLNNTLSIECKTTALTLCQIAVYCVMLNLAC